MGASTSAAAGTLPAVKPTTLHDHIRELRTRVFVVALILIVTTTLAYQYRSGLIDFLLKPLGDEKLVYLNPGGGFNFIFQVTLYAGMAATIPFFVYNLYRFIAPALPDKTRRYSVVIIISSFSLLITGIAFGYILAIPGALHFLTTFADAYVTPNLTADSYLNFILAYTAGLGILFQLPLILQFIHWAHPLTIKGLMKFQRYMIVIAFVAAAIITPTPDVMNQTLIAMPIILMYQIGVFVIAISLYRQKRRKQAPSEEPINYDDATLAELAEVDSRDQAALAAQRHAVIRSLASPSSKKAFDIIPPQPSKKINHSQKIK